MAVITPNLNVYPCVFLTKPGYEIGKVEDGKIMLYKDVINEFWKKCIAKEVHNNNAKIEDYIK